jgi:hypothetical protein
MIERRTKPGMLKCANADISNTFASETEHEISRGGRARSRQKRATADSIGEDRMNYLIIAVIAIAVAQVLTTIHAILREREINELRELVDEQRLHIVKLGAWLAGRNAAQPSRIKSEREPIREPIANNLKAPEPVITPKDLPDTIQPSTTEDELKRATKASNWSREIVAGLQAGLKGDAPPEPEIPPKAFKWFKEDADRAREIVAGPKGGAPPEPAITSVPEPAITPKDLPSTTEDELKRATKAINWLKEDADKAREIVAAQQVPPSEKIGSTTKPIRMPGIHTAQEVDAEVLEMQRLELPLMPGHEHTQAYNRLTCKKHGNAEALKEFDDALKKMMGTPPEKIG